MRILVAAPCRLWPVFVGRSLQGLPSGVATATVALVAVGPAFGVGWTSGRAAAAFGCLIVVAATTYCLGLAVAAVVLAATNLRNLASNLSYTGMVLVGFWPGWVQALAPAIPLTRGLAAIRTLATPPDGTSVAGSVATTCALAVAVGLGWLVTAAVLLECLAALGRRRGSIELAD